MAEMTGAEMTRDAARVPLRGEALAAALFAPRAVALVGASADPTKASSRPLGYLRGSGYAGNVYPINSGRRSIGAEPVYSSIEDLPEVPDHAFLMTPTAATVGAVEQCGRRGVPLVTVLAGGFAEAGPAGAQRQRELEQVAARYGIRLLGPSSLGVVNTRNGLTLTANAAFADVTGAGAGAGGTGGIVVASHSGSMIGALLSRGRVAGTAFSHLVSVGGEVDLSIGEICQATLADPAVTGYLLFLENLRHAGELRAFAAAAAKRGRPVLAYKLGRSAAAAELATSHTGVLAGEDDVADAFLADCGIARVHTLDGLLEGLPLLGRVPATPAPVAAARVGVVTTTGGGAAMVVDQLGVRGVTVVGPSAATLDALAAAGAPAAPGAIVDLTLAGTRPEVMSAALDTMLGCGEFDLVIAVVGSSARFSPTFAVQPIIDRADRPGLAAFLVPHAPEALASLRAAGVPAFGTPESCADTTYAAPDHSASVGTDLGTDVGADVGAAVGGVGRRLDEAASYALLAPLGVRAAEYRVLTIDELGPPAAATSATGTASTADGAAVSAATGSADLRFPVAVKALTGELGHKSDVGGVRLRVDAAGLAAAARDIRAAVAEHAEVDVTQVLVQTMESGLGDMLVGYRVDPYVGPLVLVAAGGVLTELYADRAIRLAPVDEATAAAMLDEVRATTVLRGYRGAPPGDLPALAALIAAVSRLAERSDVLEAEINPVLVRAQGEGALALDAVVHLRAQPAATPNTADDPLAADGPTDEEARA
ncbi:6-carboxyhexanoate-CoA ligase [Frankia canadensis]|uniref:6-carboxyhexanoate-CoA ligase n=2 Tax=Frankia canadensis TaxID=1836972 RepID=A0A2I2KV54_9ACTN|nr:6-carboxyhexanoate-CoA ligase [Frankia canadensis]SOU56822.1 6-carboxyhexanoate-CoA ligase [Frankia canadensis]